VLAAGKLHVYISCVVYPNTGPHRNYHHSNIVSVTCGLKHTFEVQEAVLVQRNFLYTISYCTLFL
jgi:hypothetical protein